MVTGTDRDLHRARASVTEATRAALLDAIIADDCALVQHVAPRILHPSAEERATAELALLNFYLPLCSDWRLASPDERDVLWQRGARACLRGLDLARALEDAACEALFEGVLGEGLLSRGRVHEAAERIDRSAALFEQLAAADWDGYRWHLGNITNVQGLAANAMRRPARARERFERALRCYTADERTELAITHLNLGGVLRVLREYEAARRVLEGALQAYEHLAGPEGRHRDPFVATACNAMGLIHADLHEWDAAWTCFGRALNAQRALADAGDANARLEIVKTLVNMGNTAATFQSVDTSPGPTQRLGEQGHSGRAALRAYRDALAIVRSLSSENAISTPIEPAALLNNIGNVLLEDGQIDEAGGCFTEAIELYRAADDLPLHREGLGVALLNRGRGQLARGDLGGARQDLQASLALRLQQERHIDAALCHEALARLEAAAGDWARAADHTHAAIDLLERGIQAIDEIEHRDKFKGPLESAYLRLIDQYARRPPKDADSLRLIRLLESSRTAELLADFGEVDRGEVEPRDMDRGDGVVSRDGVTRIGSAAWRSALTDICTQSPDELLVWVQCTDRHVVFCTIRGTITRVDTSPLSLRDILVEISAAVERHAGDEPLMRTLRASGFANWERSEWFISKCAAAYQLLPEELRQSLESVGGTDTIGKAVTRPRICLAPCGRSVNLPWELLRPPSPLASTSTSASHDFLGLTHEIVRVHRMSEVPSLRKRQPVGSRALVVGNPARSREPELKHARHSAMTLRELLHARGWSAEALLDDDATRARVVEALRAEPALWTYCGHGSEFALLLAGTDLLDRAEIAGMKLAGHPVVYLDSCRAGRTASFGGRFHGQPRAALDAGASAVLSSAIRIYDERAAVLFDAVCESLLSEPRPTVSEALLAARRRTHERYGGNPLAWSSTVLWGNPDVRLR